MFQLAANQQFQNHRPRVFVLRDPKTTANELLDGRYDFVITSYAHLRGQYSRKIRYESYIRDGPSDKHKGLIKRPILSLLSAIYRIFKLPFKHVILDEVQMAKNSDSLTHKAISCLFYQSVVMLSGTFIANTWLDSFSPIHFIPGHPFTSLGEFVRVFGSKQGEKIVPPVPTRKDRLVKFLMGFTVMRPKTYLEIPESNRHVWRFFLNDSEACKVLYFVQKYFEACRRQSIRITEELVGSSKGRVLLGYITRAQQHAAHPLLADSAEKANFKDLESMGFQIRLDYQAQIKSHNENDIDYLDFLNWLRKSSITRDAENFENPEDAKDNEDDPADPDYRDDNNNLSDDADDTGSIVPDEDEGSDVELEYRRKTSGRTKWKARVQGLDKQELISSRLIAIKDLVGKERNKKMIISSKFLLFLDLVFEMLRREFNISAIDFNGSLDDDERRQATDRFQGGGEGAVILLTPGAGGIGINLRTAEVVIQCEDWWTVAEEAQLWSRAHGEGQQNPVDYYLIRGLNSLAELVILERKEHKARVNAEIMGPLLRRDDEAPVIPAILK